MGAGQQPRDPPIPGSTFCSIAIDLYRTGYDVHMLPEDQDAQRDLGFFMLPWSGSGGQVMSEAAEEGYANLALLGYSRGGGSVHEHSEWNVSQGEEADGDQEEVPAGPQLTLVQSVYFDAVREVIVQDVDGEVVGPFGSESAYPQDSEPWDDEVDDDGRNVWRANPEVRFPMTSDNHYHIFQAPATWPADRIYELDFADTVIVARGGPIDGRDDDEGWLSHIERHGEFDELQDYKREVVERFLNRVPR